VRRVAKSRLRIGPIEAKRLRGLEDENRRLKHLVADLTLDKQTLQGSLFQADISCANGADISCANRISSDFP